jgi:sugar phosphate permease
MVETRVSGARRWLILLSGVLAQAAGVSFCFGIPLVAPQLQRAEHLTLTQVGLLVAVPALGLMCTLLAWGVAADRFGERIVIVSGLVLAGIFLLGATRSHGVVALGVFLFFAGAAGGSVNAASGRVVLGWFAPHERGTAMGVRQAAQPFGLGLAALVLPPVAHRYGVAAAMLAPALFCLVVAVVVTLVVVDPPRPQVAGSGSGPSPYRAPTIWRVHLASTFLVVPQFIIGAFSVIYLVNERNWSPIDAGRLVFVGQLLGIAGRLGAGWWSDRVGSRLRPMRQLAVASALVMLAAALCDQLQSPAIVGVLLAGALITVSDNGLAFTAVAELAGMGWAGRALGAHNTMQNVAATASPPLFGALIGAHGFAWGFVVAAVFPVISIALTPVRGEAKVEGRQAVLLDAVAAASPET